jgi:hypothetical protein
LYVQIENHKVKAEQVDKTTETMLNNLSSLLRRKEKKMKRCESAVNRSFRLIWGCQLRSLIHFAALLRLERRWSRVATVRTYSYVLLEQTPKIYGSPLASNLACTYVLYSTYSTQPAYSPKQQPGLQRHPFPGSHNPYR